jgi:hypothetical protein
MIIDKLDVVRAFRTPDEAYPELVIDPDRMLPRAIAAERFKPVRRWVAKVLEPKRRIKHDKLASCHGSNIRRKSFRNMSSQNVFQASIPKTDNSHLKNVS